MLTIPQPVIAVLEGVLIVMGAYFVLFWFGIVAWTFQDICRRSRDWLVRIISVLLVLLFHVAGLIIYLVLRPQETLASVYARTLEEEALMQGMEQKQACPKCHKPAQSDFSVCPYCGEQLKQACASCGRLLALEWSVCPTCGTAVPPRISAEEEANVATA